MRNTVLLATFVNHRRKVSSILKLIAANFEVINNKVFLLKDADKENDYILTFNVIKKDVAFSDVIRNTISLHRKRETNTLYTLNALNELVCVQNGSLDHTFTVDWEGYENCILLTKYVVEGSEDVELRKINTTLEKVIELRK